MSKNNADDHPEKGEWVRYNNLTDTYDTRDGTKVSAMLIDGASCLADILHIADIREKQRANILLAL